MKKILITGGFGFIGSNLARRNVLEGNEVTVLSRSIKKIDNVRDITERIKITIKDIKDISKDEVYEKDFVFHLAGTVDNYSLIEGQPYRDIEINCNGTISLLEALKKYNPSCKLMFASTFFVNGHCDNLPVGPNSLCNPLGMYGATRLAAEYFCHIYHNVFNLSPIIMRFTNIFGPYERGDNKKKAAFNYIISQAVKGEEIKLYNNGDFYRDYLYVDDAINACQTLAEKGEIDKTYYIGRGEFVKFKNLIDIVRMYVPSLKVDTVDPPDFHKRVGIKDFVSDNSSLKQLGWLPQVSLEEGIKRTIEYYRKQYSA